ncbi:MAG: DUF502 domain-containing protein [Candidatus Eisenbacteria bacterium]|uniref:DUF502 domain-containing protein n=1 Tax=Eiseniibacteriota bacterium TaxID=2212470 RepID=A0A956N8G2_UNCEI|nr:DUF502 domain-containing protein [Candidatus Eisenbacteria bacterium]MCB9463194.1 DUF502 domain-containing protein [Candidatus Eisenbacteria bacterium]
MSRIRHAFHLAGLAIRTRVVTGVAVIGPLAVTVWVVRFLFLRIDGLLQPLLYELIGRRIPGAGLLATLLLLYLVGLLVQTIGGRTLLHFAERILLRLPFLKDVYGSSKTIMETFTNPAGKGFKRVVSFEYPRRGCRAFGFVTNEVELADGTIELAVFLPTTPNPTSGYLLFLPSTDVEETTMTVDEAVKLIVSGGVVLQRPFASLVPGAKAWSADGVSVVIDADADADNNAGIDPRS